MHFFRRISLNGIRAVFCASDDACDDTPPVFFRLPGVGSESPTSRDPSVASLNLASASPPSGSGSCCASARRVVPAR